MRLPIGMSKTFLFLTIFIFTFSFSLAIGMSPPIIEADYQEGTIYEFDVKIINNGASTSAIRMNSEGPYADYVDFSKDMFEFKSGQAYETIKVVVRLPSYDKLTHFGKQRIVIRASEGAPTQSSGFFAVTTAISGWFIIDIPVPGQYGTVESFAVDNTLDGGEAAFRMLLRNRGTQDLNDASAIITVTDYSGFVLDTLTYPTINIGVEEDFELAGVIPSSSYDPSLYFAHVSFRYNVENAPQNKSDQFFVGSTDIQLLDYTKNLTIGKINKIKLDLQSLWGSPLRNIRGVFSFQGGEQSLPVIDFDAFEKISQEVFIDVPQVNASTLDATLELEIPVDAQNTFQKSIPLSFTLIQEVEPSNEFPLSTNTILIIVLVLVVLILVSLNIFLYKKRKK